VKKLPNKTSKPLQFTREKIISNAWQLLKNSIKLYEQKEYPIATFLAMSAIEEIGKLLILPLPPFEGNGLEPVYEFDAKKNRKIIRDHLAKAILAAGSSLCINAGADRRHGIHPESKILRSSGVILLARSGRWMKIRNSCLYTDGIFTPDKISSPSDSIFCEHAYYFICMGFEILAEQAEMGYGFSVENDNTPKGIEFWKARLNDLEKFMERWSDTINLDRLDFLANPEPLRKEATKKVKKAR